MYEFETFFRKLTSISAVQIKQRLAGKRETLSLRFPDYAAVSLARPLARRRLITALPVRVAIFALKPCLRLRLLTDG